MESEASQTRQAPRRMSNTGHGHVKPRDDGIKARCGGPNMCLVCAYELVAQLEERMPVRPKTLEQRVSDLELRVESIHPTVT